MSSFGESGLPGVPRRTLRLAAAALGARGEVEHPLPGEVLDLAASEDVVLARVLEVDRLAVGVHRQHRAERVRTPRERDVERRDEDVQVLAVDHEHEEAEDHREVDEDADGGEPLVCRLTERLEDRGEELGREGEVVGVGEVVAVDLRSAVEEQRPDDHEDHEQDEPRGAGVRAVEAREASEAVRVLLDPDCGEDDERGEDGHGEEVLDERDPCPLVDDRDRQIGVDDRQVGLEDGEAEDDEAPEREEVGDPWDGPLQQLALAQHLDRLGLDQTPRVGKAALRAALPHEDEPHEHEGTASDDERRDQSHHQADGQRWTHRSSCRVSTRCGEGSLASTNWAASLRRQTVT